MGWVKISKLWCLRKAEAYLEVRRAFSQAPGRERLAQIAGEDRPIRGPERRLADHHVRRLPDFTDPLPLAIPELHEAPNQTCLRAMKFIIHNSKLRIFAAAPYTFLGPAVYVTHQGERPMSITWNLHHPMPAELFEETKVAAVKDPGSTASRWVETN